MKKNCFFLFFSGLFFSCTFETVNIVKEHSVSAEIFTVTYQTEYGSAPVAFMCQDGFELTEEKLPVPDGTETYRFSGWYVENEKISTGFKITKNTLLKAKYERYAIRVNYDLGEADNYLTNERNPEIIDISSLPYSFVPLEDFADFKFEGWKNESNEIINELPVDFSNDIKICACWKRESYDYVKVNHYLVKYSDVYDDQCPDRKQYYPLGYLGDPIQSNDYSFVKSEYRLKSRIQRLFLVRADFEPEIILYQNGSESGYNVFQFPYSQQYLPVYLRYVNINPDGTLPDELDFYYNLDLFYVNFELLYKNNNGTFVHSGDCIKVWGQYGTEIHAPAEWLQGLNLQSGYELCYEDENLIFSSETNGLDCYVYAIPVSTSLKPREISIPSVIRDFRGFYTNINGQGCITTEIAERYGLPFKAGYGHPDFGRINAEEKEIIKSELGTDDKPVFNSSSLCGITEHSLNYWFNDDNLVNITLFSRFHLVLNSDGYIGGSQDSYYPINRLGFGNENQMTNNYWTAEMEFFFDYHGGETIRVDCTDDCWIFINGKLAIDLGGCHAMETDTVTLTSSEANRFDLIPGNSYKIKIFKANRQPDISGFMIWLKNFDSIYF